MGWNCQNLHGANWSSVCTNERLLCSHLHLQGNQHVGAVITREKVEVNISYLCLVQMIKHKTGLQVVFIPDKIKRRRILERHWKTLH